MTCILCESTCNDTYCPVCQEAINEVQAGVEDELELEVDELLITSAP